MILSGLRWFAGEAIGSEVLSRGLWNHAVSTRGSWSGNGSDSQRRQYCPCLGIR